MKIEIIEIRVDRIQTLGRHAGRVYNPTIVCRDSETSREYAIVLCNAPNGERRVALMDRSEYGDRSFFVAQNGYVHFRDGGNAIAHHAYVMKNGLTFVTIDHINWQKTDNRRENLRLATQSQQNSNRFDRKDKQPPPKEIVDLGIDRLPRYVRWDKSESKFVVDGHSISGTKSKKVTVANRLRECLLKYITVLEKTDSEQLLFFANRVKLAEEYNSLVKFARDTLPDVFPNGPFADVEDLCSDLEYCKICIDRLPKLNGNEILHGALTHDRKIAHLPTIRSIAILKNSKMALFDDKFKDLLEKLPTFDVSGSTPVMVATNPLRQLFPDRVTLQDVATKRKFSMKEVVFCFFNQGRLEDSQTIIPINYQQYDLRIDNLQVVVGNGKQHKSCEGIPHAPLDFPMKYLPRSIGLVNAKSKWTFYGRSEAKDMKKIDCQPENAATVFTQRVVPHLRTIIPEFDSQNDVYQRLLAEYVDALENTSRY